MIEIKLLNRAALQEFIHSPEFDRMPSIPITKHRALSHINNPRADETDTLLILAFAGNEMVGYLGLLPDFIFVADEQYKCVAFSCFWVHPEFRGKGIAATLVQKAYELYKLIVVSDYVPFTKKVYDRSGLFGAPLTFDGVRLYMRLDLHNILPPKSVFFRRTRPLLQIGDMLVNFFFDARFLFFSKKLKGGSVEYLRKVDDETANFISGLQSKELFKRNLNELNWILDYPWVLPEFKGDKDSKRYHFTSTDKTFSYSCLKIRNEENQLVAFLLFTNRNRVLRMPYCYLKPDALNLVAETILRHIYEWKINTFITYHPALSSFFLTHKTGQIFKKRTKKHCLFSKELYRLVDDTNFGLQDGDVDAAFT